MCPIDLFMTNIILKINILFNQARQKGTRLIIYLGYKLCKVRRTVATGSLNLHFAFSRDATSCFRFITSLLLTLKHQNDPQLYKTDNAQVNSYIIMDNLFKWKFMTKKQLIYFERVKFIVEIGLTYVQLWLSQAVSGRLPIAVARVQTRVWSCGILWWTKVALRPGFLRELLFPLPIYIPSISPQSSSLSPEADTIGQEWPQCQ
jgi:hypothetical protein